jgi:N-ethylmaleimide reductase
MHSLKLFEPFDMKGLQLNNRIVMAPMTRNRARNDENKVTELTAMYYRQRSSAGLIITEGSQISREGVGYIYTPGIYSEAQVEAWKLVTRTVHDKGGKIFIQLWHVGRVSHPDFLNGDLPVAPSAISPNDQSFTLEDFKPIVTPKALTKDGIRKVKQDYVDAAANAVKAGFDGVEIHSSNGYLLHQFFTSCSNIRTDEYGGSVENRARILFEILDQMKEVIPENRIGVRLNPSLHANKGIVITKDTIPTFEYITDRLNNYDLAYLHLSEPFTEVDDVPHAVTFVAKHFRPIYKGVIITNKGYTKKTGNKVINEGYADLVAFGTLFIANPDLVKRFEIDAPLAEADRDTYYATGADGSENLGEKGYTDYPFHVE